MKTQVIKSWLPAGLCIMRLTVAAAFAPALVHATTLDIDPAAQVVVAGDPFDLAVRIGGLGNHTAPSLGTFDMNLLFDPALVQLNAVSFGDPVLGNLLGPVAGSVDESKLNPAGDAVNLFSLSLDTAADLALAQPSGFILTSLHFTALAAGIGNFSLDNIILGDAEGVGLPVDRVGSARVTILAGRLPETMPFWSVALALGAVVLGHHESLRRGSVSYKAQYK